MLTELSKIMLVNSLDPTIWSVEVIDLNSSVTTCATISHYPLAVRGTVGGLLNKEIPLVCGGTEPENNLCYQYKQGAWTPGR
jgi:hypothetical protein